jgi:pyruvate dehydrogenase E2 component (dihydrolipoamide acetyltransferase)
MSTRIEMPELSSDGEGAALATWLVAVGDRVEKGDVIAELETDKSTLELEAPATGTIARLEVDEGTEDIAPGTLLGVLEAEETSEAEDVSEAEDTPEAEAATPEAAAPAPAEPAVEASGSSRAPAAPAATRPGSAPGERPSLRTATPLARRAARDHEVDLASVVGSGPRGRVVEQDVLQSAAPAERTATSPETEASPGTEAPSPSRRGASEHDDEGRRVRLSSMRRTIARRMTEAKQQVPHFYLRIRCGMDAVLDARAALNRELDASDRGLRISVNDFVVRAAALALRDVPEANVRFAGEEMIELGQVDVAVAVATEGGLVTPVVRDADRKGLAVLAGEVQALAADAREGRLRRDQYEGGSFTISNLGMYGVETVYPILNLPQACILGVGAAEEVPIVREGGITVGRQAAFTLAADHRAVDGAVGARLLAALREKLEDPLSMLF